MFFYITVGFHFWYRSYAASVDAELYTEASEDMSAEIMDATIKPSNPVSNIIINR